MRLTLALIFIISLAASSYCAVESDVATVPHWAISEGNPLDRDPVPNFLILYLKNQNKPFSRLYDSDELTNICRDVIYSKTDRPDFYLALEGLGSLLSEEDVKEAIPKPDLSLKSFVKLVLQDQKFDTDMKLRALFNQAGSSVENVNYYLSNQQVADLVRAIRIPRITGTEIDNLIKGVGQYGGVNDIDFYTFSLAVQASLH